jgi:aminoglycoside phosphotransferase (APT) family kinase protein
MPVPAQRDPLETRARLREWFVSRGAREVTVSEIWGPESTGYSHESLLFDVCRDGVTERLVARVAPTHHTVFLEPDFAAEFRVVQALSSSDVPVPRVHDYEDDPGWLGAPFYLMDRVDGRIPGDSPPYTTMGWLYDAAPDERERVWWGGLEALAAVHHVASAPFSFLERDELAYYERYMDWASEGSPPAVIVEARDWLRANRPPVDNAALCWGDSRLGNQVFDDGRCVAVLDWEMATIADPVQDLAWFVYFDRMFSLGIGVPRLEGLPHRDETAVRWESLTGRSAKHLRYYEVYAGFRFAVIMARLARLMIAVGRLPADSDFATNNFANTFLETTLNERAPG